MAQTGVKEGLPGVQRVSTGFIARNIHQLHKEGVLQKMKDMYLQETQKFFATAPDGKKSLRPEYVLDVACPLCERSGAKFLVQVNGFRHLRCDGCDLVYVSPRLKDEYIWEQYSRPSYSFMFKHLIQDTIDFRKNVIAYGKFQWVTKYLKNPGGRTLLDIGSGMGENLAVYKENGWDVWGIEFNEYAAEYSRKKFDVPVFNEPIEKAKLPAKQFDVITMWGVLEHLTEPVQTLEGILPHLAPGGALVFMVPNFDSLLGSYLVEFNQDSDRLFDGDKHIAVYSQGSIEFLARRMGLEAHKIVSRGLDIVTILGYVQEAEGKGRLARILDKEMERLQRALEEAGLGDGLWAMLIKPR